MFFWKSGRNILLAVRDLTIFEYNFFLNVFNMIPLLQMSLASLYRLIRLKILHLNFRNALAVKSLLQIALDLLILS